jgi:hypothetical protein
MRRMGPPPMVLKVCRCFSIGISSTLMWTAMAHGQTVPSPVSATGGSNSSTLAQGTRAESLSYGADVGIGESDNVTLVRTDKVSQTIAITDLDIDFKDQTRRFGVDAKGDFSYLDYLQNAYGNQLIGRFDGRADVSLIPERVTWVLTENFGQSQIDPFTAAIRKFSIGTDSFLGLERPVCKSHLSDRSFR